MWKMIDWTMNIANILHILDSLEQYPVFLTTWQCKLKTQLKYGKRSCERAYV